MSLGWRIVFHRPTWEGHRRLFEMVGRRVRRKAAARHRVCSIRCPAATISRAGAGCFPHGRRPRRGRPIRIAILAEIQLHHAIGAVLAPVGGTRPGERGNSGKVLRSGDVHAAIMMLASKGNSALSFSAIFARGVALVGAAAILTRRLTDGDHEPAWGSAPAIPRRNRRAASRPSRCRQPGDGPTARRRSRRPGSRSTPSRSVSSIPAGSRCCPMATCWSPRP